MANGQNNGAEQLRHNLLGRGLQLRQVMPGYDVGVDLVLTMGPAGIDLAQVQDMANLEQGLTLALTTALGSDVFNSEFGFDGLNALAEEPDPLMQRERIRVSIIRLLQKDARIKRIVDVKLDGGQLDRATRAGQSQQERMSARGTLDITVVFETHTGDQTQVQFNQVNIHG